MESGSKVSILTSHVVIQNGQETNKSDRGISIVNPVQVAIIGHRFMSIAEQVSRKFMFAFRMLILVDGKYFAENFH